MLYCLAISMQNGVAKSRFFTDNGSMQGGACTILSIFNDAGTNSGIVQTDASWSSMYGRKNSHT